MDSNVNHLCSRLPAHDVAQLLQVGCGEVVIVAVAALHVFVYPMEVEGDCVQQLDLHTGNIRFNCSEVFLTLGGPSAPFIFLLCHLLDKL